MPSQRAHLEKRWRNAHPCVFGHLVPPMCSTALTDASFSVAVGWKSPEPRSPGSSTVLQVSTAAGMLSGKPTLAPSCCRTARHATSARKQGDFAPCSWGIIPPCSCPQSLPALAIQSAAATPFHAPICQAGEGLEEEAGLPICQGLFSV